MFLKNGDIYSGEWYLKYKGIMVKNKEKGPTSFYAKIVMMAIGKLTDVKEKESNYFQTDIIG